MKIRNGFVSNSSSSSYVIDINVTPKRFYETMWSEYAWDLFDKNKILAELDNRITEHKKKLADGNSIENSDTWKEFAQSWHDSDVKWKKRFSRKSTDAALVKLILQYNQIHIIEDASNVELNGTTSMHNDFNDGMPPIMREIALYFLMDTACEVTGKRIDES